jgi:hypothetical protein
MCRSTSLEFLLCSAFMRTRASLPKGYRAFTKERLRSILPDEYLSKKMYGLNSSRPFLWCQSLCLPKKYLVSSGYAQSLSSHNKDRNCAWCGKRREKHRFFVCDKIAIEIEKSVINKGALLQMSLFFVNFLLIAPEILTAPSLPRRKRGGVVAWDWVRSRKGRVSGGHLLPAFSSSFFRRRGKESCLK